MTLSREDILQDKVLKRIFRKRSQESKIYQNVDEFGKEENTKQRFIDAYYPDKTLDAIQRRNAKQLFYKTYDMENRLQKDIYDFSMDELEALLHSFNSTSIASIEVRLCILKKYIDFCIDSQVKSSNINFLKKRIDPVQFVLKNLWKNKYPNRETLLNICELLPTAQLAILLILPFMGIIGKHTYELRHLKEEDVDLDNKVIYVREYTEANQKTGEIITHPERIVHIDEEFVPYIKRAIEATSYIDVRVNGVVVTKDISPTNPYVVKRVKLSKNDPRADKVLANSGVTARFFNLKSIFKGEPWLVSKLSPVTLEYCAMMEELRELEKIKGTLSPCDYQNIMIQHQRNSTSYSTLKKMYEQIRKDEQEEQELMEIKSRLEDIE